MFNIKKFLESVNDESQFAGTKAKPAQRPGDQVRGQDRATPRKDRLHPFAGRLVGNESCIKELADIDKDKSLEWKLTEEFERFKEAAQYGGIDPIVRQRMGMQPATQDEIRSYRQANPPGVRSGSGQTWTTRDNKPVLPGGEVDVANAALKATPVQAPKVPLLPREPAAAQPAVSADTAATTTPVGTSSIAPAATPAAQPAAEPGTTTTGKLPPAKALKPAVKKPGPWDDLLKLNPSIKNPNLIYPGQEIKLPDGTSTIVGRGDTLSGISKLFKQGAFKDGTPVNETSFRSLVQRLRDISAREHAMEQENAAVNMQDPDAQVTSQTSAKQDPEAVKQQQIAQAQDKATARSTMTGLSTALGPKVDTNALSSAVNKISDGEPLSGPEATSMSALTPLIAKAAETPQSASALRTALANAALLAKQGK
jgi:hypothetical protein